ncbi:hypothetical protein Bca4012_047472 [Brassica carinata]
MSLEGFSTKARGLGNNNNMGGGGTGTKCGRWNPTVEQVKLLTDLFKAGLRTPSTDQIQKISTELSVYDTFEGCEEEENVIETLQLFPLSNVERANITAASYNEYIREHVNTTVFSTYSSCGAEMEHPPLDLRLSFL